jgi:hypothetical protein
MTLEPEQNIQTFLDDEAMWNSTYREEFKSINLSVIKDGLLFEKT